MNFAQLNYLVDLAQSHSVHRTSERFFVTRQAVSKSIKQLEDELGCALLIRTSSGVALTEAGKEMIMHAQRILAEQEQMVLKAKQLTAAFPEQFINLPQLQICSASVTLNALLPNILSHKNFKQTAVPPLRITMSNSLEEIIDSLQRNNSNLGLISINEEDLCKLDSYQKTLNVVILHRDYLVAVVDKSRHNDETIFTWEQLSSHLQLNFNIISLERYRESQKEYTVINSGDVEFHRNMIRVNDAVVLMPNLSHHIFFNDKHLIALPINPENEPIKYVHIAIYKKNEEQIQFFVEQLQKEIISNYS